MEKSLFQVFRGRFPWFLRAGLLMAALDEMWARFSLTKEEEGGVEVPKDMEESIHQFSWSVLYKTGF